MCSTNKSSINADVTAITLMEWGEPCITHSNPFLPIILSLQLLQSINSPACMIIKFIERIIKFSETLGPSDLALWLLQEVGNDYGDDIEKLKGTNNYNNNI